MTTLIWQRRQGSVGRRLLRNAASWFQQEQVVAGLVLILIERAHYASTHGIKVTLISLIPLYLHDFD